MPRRPGFVPAFDEVLVERLVDGQLHSTETGELVPLGRRTAEFAAAVEILARRGMPDSEIAGHFTSNGFYVTDRRILRMRHRHGIAPSGTHRDPDLAMWQRVARYGRAS